MIIIIIVNQNNLTIWFGVVVKENAMCPTNIVGGRSLFVCGMLLWEYHLIISLKPRGLDFSDHVAANEVLHLATLHKVARPSVQSQSPRLHLDGAHSLEHFNLNSNTHRWGDRSGHLDFARSDVLMDEFVIIIRCRFFSGGEVLGHMVCDVAAPTEKPIEATNAVPAIEEVYSQIALPTPCHGALQSQTANIIDMALFSGFGGVLHNIRRATDEF